MTSYYRVSPKFWADPHMRGLSEDGRSLALYLLTSPHRTAEGLFRLPRMYAADDLQWSLERLDKPFTELIEAGFCRVDEQVHVVWLCNALEYQTPSNENMVKHAVSQLRNLPETSLFPPFSRAAERLSERLAKGLAEQFPERLGNPPALTPSPTPLQSSASLSPKKGTALSTEPRTDHSNTQAMTEERQAELRVDLPDLPTNTATSLQELRNQRGSGVPDDRQDPSAPRSKAS